VFDRPSVQLMVTGAYTIQEMSCKNCDAYLGWRMIRAHEPDEKWKEGKYILELRFLEKEHRIAAKKHSEDAKKLKRSKQALPVSSFKFVNFIFPSSTHAFDMDTSWLEVR
jgi:Yippee zinc-binding/DNA-binding /Mis18, centromere assembly